MILDDWNLDWWSYLTVTGACKYKSGVIRMSRPQILSLF